jgi:Tol biopolymer transport system component
VPLSPGSRLGPYEIVAALGAGGMGEVYKAKDTRLDRVVAIKVLASHLSASPELQQRFEREARAISSLSHAHICTLYDVGHQDGVDYLVMEHLEGESLAQRLARGPLPPEQVLRLGVEIASALDSAHRQGIVHRDLKPGNVVLTKSGAKLLDFGLAKIAAGPIVGTALDGLTSLPTEAVGGAPLTTEGTLLGTFQYMAPEQLEGKEADARTDIFAFGAVLYEMATGRPAFAGKSRASLISAIMSSSPAPIASVQPLTPPALERVVRTCMAKEPDDRWQTAHDVMLQLQWIAEGGSAAGLPAPVAARRARREHLAWAIAAIALIAAGALAFRELARPRPAPATMRFTITAPTGIRSMGLPRISPDGLTLAFDATDSTGRNSIWIRPISSLTANPLPGTDGAGRPFWSPDNRFIGFVANGKLKKVPVAGGPAEIVCDTPPTGSDGTWSRDGVILFDGGDKDPIRRVLASGGVAAAEVASDSTGESAWPLFLPDGKHFLFTKGVAGKFELAASELGSRKIKLLGIKVSRVEYSPDGYVLFVRDQSLLAQRFDARRLALSGDPFPVADPLASTPFGHANFSVSANGVLVYRNSAGSTGRLVWLDRTGRELETVAPPADYRSPALSPDGRRIAIRRRDRESNNLDIWIMEPARGTATRFTFDPSNDGNPLWFPDGSHVVYGSDREGGVMGLYVKSASGLGEDEQLCRGHLSIWADDISPDGKYLMFTDFTPETDADLLVMPMEGDHKPRVFLRTPFTETHAKFSPDGRWVAYSSTESGRPEVYVQAFEGTTGKWQVSTSGGFEPHWRADGKELFFASTDGKLMAVDVKPGATLEFGVPKALFDMQAVPGIRNNFVVAPDGQRFLYLKPQSEALTPTTIVLNWSAGAKLK